eukprot:PhF_6_TR42930/c0_g1_i3/m.65149
MSYHITDDEPFHPTADILTRLRLELFLETYCPARLSQIDSIMDFYQGNDEALFHDLQKSYPNSVVPTPRDVYRHELHTFYEHHDSSKIKNIELMLDKFEGHEDVLFVDLYERYSKTGQQQQPPSKNTSRRSSLGRETATSTDIASIREQLRQYLTQRDPRRLSKLDRIMEYYKGRETDIFKDLEKHQEMLQAEQQHQQQEVSATTAVDGEDDDGIKYDSGVALAYIRYMAFQNPEKMVEIHDTLRVVDSMGPSFLAGLEMPPNDVVLPVEYPQMLHLHHLLLLRLQTAAKEALQLNEHLTKEGKAVVAARLEAIEAMHERTSARIISVAEDFQKKCRRSQSESLPSNNGGASSYANTSVPPTPSVPPLNQKQFDDDILGFPQTRGDRGGGVSVPPSFPEFDMVGGEESISLPDTPPLQTQALTDLLRGFEVALLDVHQELAELRSMMLNNNNSSNKPSSPRSVTTSGGRSASTNLLQPQQQTQQTQQQQPPAILPLRNLNGDTIGYVSTEKNVGSNHSNNSSTTGREEFTRGQSFDGTVMNPSRGSSAVSVNVGPPPPLLSRGNSQYVNAAAIPPDFEEFGGVAENTGRNVTNDAPPSRLGVEAARRLSTLEQETQQQPAITSNTSNPMDPLFRAKAMLHILQDAAPPGASFEMTISEDGKTSFAVKTGPTQPPTAAATTTQIPPQMVSSDAGEGGNQQRGGQLPTSPTSPITRNPNTTPKVLPHPNVLKNLKSMVTMICHVIVVRRSFERVSSSPRHGSRSPSSPARGAPPQRYPQQQQQQQLSSSPPNWEEYEGVFSPPATRQPQAAQPQQQRLKSSASPIREGSDDSRIPSIVRSIFDRTRAIQQLSDDLPQSEEGGGVPYSNYQPPPYLRGYWSTYPTPDGNGGKQQQQKGVSWAPNIEQIQPDIDDDERPRQYPQIYRVPTTTSTSPSPSSDNGRSLKLFPNFSGSGGSAGSNGGGNGSPRNRHGGVQTPAVPKGVPIQFPPPNLTEAPKPWQTQASRNLNL